jgi:cytochrome c oxidase subunit 2
MRLPSFGLFLILFLATLTIARYAFDYAFAPAVFTAVAVAVVAPTATTLAWHFLMSRYVIALLFLAVPILGVYTFVAAKGWGWWFPEEVSTYGQRIDSLFNWISVPIVITFVATELVLAWCVLKFADKSLSAKAMFTHGNHKLEMIWTAIPAVLLIAIAIGQIGPFTAIKFQSGFPKDGAYSIDHPLAEVYASQFDWRVRYPDAEGRFDGIDVIESHFEFVVPVNTDVVFRLKSRDVLHAFFVPAFRLKQDAVPGMTIPMWFNAEKTGVYDLICAELCGWGHYKMAGRVRVLEKEEFDAWLAGQREALYSNGSDF